MTDKRGLSESDICDRFITPALERSGWQNTQWRREYSFTDGQIIVKETLVGVLFLFGVDHPARRTPGEDGATSA